jgi:hypothetical protein
MNTDLSDRLSQSAGLIQIKFIILQNEPSKEIFIQMKKKIKIIY